MKLFEKVRGIARAFGTRNVDGMKIAELADLDLDKEDPAIRELLSIFNALKDEDRAKISKYAKAISVMRLQEMKRKSANI